MVRFPLTLRATLEAEELPGPGPEAGEEGQTKEKGGNSRRDERAEAQRSRVTCPESHSPWGAGTRALVVASSPLYSAIMVSGHLQCFRERNTQFIVTKAQVRRQGSSRRRSQKSG